MQTAETSRAYRVGQVIGQALAVIVAGVLLGIAGAWVAIRARATSARPAR